MNNSGLFNVVPFERVFVNIVGKGIKHLLLKSEELVLSCDEYYLLAIQRGLI